MGVFVVANQRLEVSGRHSWLEAIHQSNMARRVMKPNSFFNEVLLGKDKGKFKPIPDEILDVRPLYTGTVGVVGAKGKPLGDTVESQCEYAGSIKTVVTKPDSDEVGLVDTMVLCDHGFAADGKPFLALINARTEKPIRSDEEMGEANTVLLKLNGQTRCYILQRRDGGLLEVVGNENTTIYVSDSATLGLFGRDAYESMGWKEVDLFDLPSNRRRIVVAEATPKVACRL